jgi:predicted Zn-dependent peptidase
MDNYIKVKSKTDLSGFYIVYYGSTLNEYKGIYGISHLMEHLVCKGIDHLMDDFEKDGISWNAYTSDRNIVFYMTGLDEYVNKWKKIFYESILNFNVTEEQFLNEKKIVLEEYNMSFNTQSESHWLNLYRKLFNNYGPIGLREDLENITLKDCQNYFQVQYTKPHKIIDVSKCNHVETEKFFESINYSKTNIIKNFDYIKENVYPFERENEYKTESSIINISKVITNDLPLVEFICRMLSGGLKSPLVQEVREKKGLVYSIGSYLHEPVNGAGIVIISTETSNKNQKEVQDTIQYVIENPEEFLTKERFEIVRQYYEIKFRKEKESRHSAVNNYIYNTQAELELLIFTDSISYSDILAVYKENFKWGDFYQSFDKNEFDGNEKVI